MEIDKQYKKVLSTLSVAKNEKGRIGDDIQNLVEIEQKILDYDLYLLALSKDGVPYELISRAIPAVEKEIFISYSYWINKCINITKTKLYYCG